MEGKKLILRLSIATLLLATTLSAQGINDLISSERYKNFKKGGSLSRTDLSDYQGTSEYLKLFTRGKNGIKPLLSWLGTGSGQFKRGRTELITDKGFIGASAQFAILNSESEDKIYMTIYVPKPQSVSASTMGLYKEFRQIQPPDLVVEQVENIEIDSLSGKVFYHKTGACSLLVTLTKGAILNLYTKTCANREPLIELGKSLDLSRTIQKLNN